MTNTMGIEMLTLDLKKSNNQEIIQGKLILNISTNVTGPIRNGSTRQPISRNPSSHSVATTSAPIQQQQQQQPPPPHTARSTEPTMEEARNSDLPEG